MQDVKDPVYLKKLGNHIRELRKLKGLSQLDLAIKMNNFAEYVGKIERGEVNSTVCMLKTVASGLGISMSQLFEFDSDSQ